MYREIVDRKEFPETMKAGLGIEAKKAAAE